MLELLVQLQLVLQLVGFLLLQGQVFLHLLQVRPLVFHLL
jgi:hypothetical protein